jgi:phage/plasmid-associated DNA primase
LKQMVEMTSPVTAFAEECCEIRSGATVSAAMVYEAWQRWCADTGRKPGIQAQFGRWLMQACPGVSKTRSRIDGELSYAYDDLRLQKWVYNKYLGRP